MEILKRPPTFKGPPEWFTGDVWVDVIGIALIGSRGQIIEAHPGDVIWTPPGEEHWHGAAPG